MIFRLFQGSHIQNFWLLHIWHEIQHTNLLVLNLTQGITTASQEHYLFYEKLKLNYEKVK